MLTFGEHLRAIRQDRQMTQVDLAKRAKLSQSYLARMEADKYAPTVDVLRRLMKALEPGDVKRFVRLAIHAGVPEDLRRHL